MRQFRAASAASLSWQGMLAIAATTPCCRNVSWLAFAFSAAQPCGCQERAAAVTRSSIACTPAASISSKLKSSMDPSSLQPHVLLCNMGIRCGSEHA